MDAVPGNVVVANPSSTPEIVHAAGALGQAGELRGYYVPIATTPAQLALVQAFLPRTLGQPVLREMARRRVPSGVPSPSVRRIAYVTDVARVGASRLRMPQPIRTHLTHHLRRRVDYLVARDLSANDHALLAVAGSAVRCVRRARDLGIMTALDANLGHMGWLRDLTREEARLVPDYACTLQAHNFSDELIAEHDEQLAMCTTILAVSSHARTTLLERGIDERKVVVTHLGVDLDLFQPPLRPRSGTAGFNVSFVGQVTQRKGISYLVEAFKQAGIPDSRLTLVGEIIGSSRPWSHVPGVHHVPPVPRTALPAMYAAADVYVLPSLGEGFPLTALEAMASGLPVIISEHTFADDVVTDGLDGYVVPIRDSQAIAERLRTLWADPDLRTRMGTAARQRAEDFGWDRYGTQMVDLMTHPTP